MISSRNAHFAKRLFNFILIHSKNSEGPVGYTLVHRHGELSLWCGPDQKFSSPEENLFILGELFEFNSSSPESSDGYFVGVRFNSEGALLFRSPGSPLGIFYGSPQGRPVAFSDFFEARWVLPDPLEVDPEAADDFLEFGMISLGSTLFRDLFRLQSFTNLRLDPSGQWHVVAEPSISVTDETSLPVFIQQRFRKWMRGVAFRSVALSGGMDSRLIAASLKESRPRQEVRIFTRTHPSLDEREDRDVLTAKELSRLLPFPHDVQKSNAHELIYLSQSSPAEFPILSGMYGGEILGGEALPLVDLEALETSSRQGPLKSSVERRRTPGVALQEDVALKIEILTEAFLISIYGGYWFTVCSNQNLAYLPFWDAQVLSRIKLLKASELSRYRLYRKVFDDLAEEFKAVPLNSPTMVSYWPELPSQKFGREPKAAQIANEPLRAQILFRERNAAVLESFLELLE